MFNAEGIIELEKKWLSYKTKQRSKLSIFIIFALVIFTFASYQVYSNLYIVKNIPKEKAIKAPVVLIDKPLIAKPTVKKEINSTKNTLPNEKKIDLITLDKIESKEKNNTIISTLYIKNKKLVNEINTTSNKDINITISKKLKILKVNYKPYFFKLEPTDQGSELFTSNGFLALNVPLQIKEVPPVKIKKQQVIETIRSLTETTLKKKEPNKISIDSKEVDTIKYLKEKYYATSSIVFALMLAEEYYYEKDYKNSLQWALTANDDDSQNTKSWSWFAKAKVKLGQKEDAIRALKAYLSNNNSKRLSTLLRKIELGDTNDK